MAFEVGKRVVAESESTDRRPRSGVVEEVLRGDPSPRYRIRWDDGHESIYTPASGALRAEHARRGNGKRHDGAADLPEIRRSTARARNQTRRAQPTPRRGPRTTSRPTACPCGEAPLGGRRTARARVACPWWCGSRACGHAAASRTPEGGEPPTTTQDHSPIALSCRPIPRPLLARLRLCTHFTAAWAFHGAREAQCRWLSAWRVRGGVSWGLERIGARRLAARGQRRAG